MQTIFKENSDFSSSEVLDYFCPEIDIRMNGIKIKALVDTGSKLTCVSEKFYDLHKSCFIKCPTFPFVGVDITGFDGEKSKKLKTQFMAEVTIANKTRQIIFAVVPKLIKDVIFGIDATKEFKILIDTENDKIICNNCEIFYDKTAKSVSDTEMINQIFLNFIDTHEDQEEDNEDITFEEINNKVNECKNLTLEEKKQLENLVWEYRDVFSTKPGLIKNFEYELKLREGVEEHFFKSYPVPRKYEEAVEKEMNRMLKQNLIQRSNSTWINPLVIVAKKDGSVRLCLDARHLNEKLQNDYDSPEALEDIFRDCGETGIMSSFDFNSSFHQCKLKPSSTRYCAFIYKGRTYEFLVVPFGIKPATAALVRGTERIKNKHKNIKNFVDDFLCISKDFSEHLVHLKEFFQTLREENVTVSLRKSQFCREEIEFLGNIITPKGIKPNPEKFEKIRNFPIPKNVKQLQGFFGLINFCSKFTEKHAQYSVKLRQLERKNIRWRWGEEEQFEFDRLKSLFVKERTLEYPVKGKPFFIFTDASDVAVGAALCQKDDNNEYKIIYMASRMFKGPELSYFTTEKELLAIKWACEKFRSYIYGERVYIMTDHQALVFLNKCRFLNQRLMRLSLCLQEYDLHIAHIKGKFNTLADILSRIDSLNVKKGNEIFIAAILARQVDKRLIKNLQNIRELQLKDQFLNKIKTKMKNDEFKKFVFRDGLIFKNNKIFLPESIVNNFIIETHEVYGHMGTLKTMLIMNERFTFRRMRHKISKLIRSCDSCQRNKINTQGSFAEMHSIKPSRIKEHLSIDFVGPLPTSIGGTQFILVIMDTFSKFVNIFKIKKATTNAVKNCLTKYFLEHGKPEKIQADRGSQFASKNFVKFCQDNNIKLIFSSVRHPQGNMVERANREIIRICRTMIKEKHTEWAKYIDFVQDCLNNSVHETTGFTPMELYKNEKPTRFWDSYLDKYFQLQDELKYDEKLEITKKRIMSKAAKRADTYNKKHKVTKLKVNDLVLMKANNVSSAVNKTIAKFFAIYKGPYIVEKVNNNNTYQLTNFYRKSIGTFHIKDLKKYVSMETDSGCPEEAEGGT